MPQPKNVGVKPNETWTHAYLKAYVRALGLNHPQVKMSMTKANMIAGLKAAKHWGPRAPSFPASKMTAKGGPKSVQGKKVSRSEFDSARAQLQAGRAARGRGRPRKVSQADADQARTALRGMLGKM